MLKSIYIPFVIILQKERMRFLLFVLFIFSSRYLKHSFYIVLNSSFVVLELKLNAFCKLKKRDILRKQSLGQFNFCLFKK